MDILEKGKKVPVGTIHNGFKKIAEGKWRKVSIHGMTKEEHKKEADRLYALPKGKDKFTEQHIQNEYNLHQGQSRELDSKEYSDQEVLGKENKNDKIASEVASIKKLSIPEGKVAVIHSQNGGKDYGFSFHPNTVKEGDTVTLADGKTKVTAEKVVGEEDKKESKYSQGLNKFMEQFPDDATKWSQATGELADLHKELAERYNDSDYNGNYKNHEGTSKTPAESNQRHKKGIRELMGKMKKEDVDDILSSYKQWFKNKDVQKALTTLEIGYLNGEVSKEVIEKARMQVDTLSKAEDWNVKE